MINNRTDDQTANVSYIEIDVPKNQINLEMVHDECKLIFVSAEIVLFLKFNENLRN